jgi:hypothetical protein
MATISSLRAIPDDYLDGTEFPSGNQELLDTILGVETEL